MKNKGKYMAQTPDPFGGLIIKYGDTIRQVLKKININPKIDKPREYGLFVAKDGMIVRIRANGKEC